LKDKSQSGKGSWLAVVAPLVGFLVVVAVGLVLWAGQQGKAREHRREVRDANAAAGLPADFPQDIVPLYEGAVVKSAERGEATSVDGAPMDSWEIVADIDNDDRKGIFDYYNDLLLDRGFRQTQVISMPSHDSSGPNYAVDYGNEDMSLSFIIEKKSSDEMTQLEISVYRLR
jgi:hypothetical protein